MNSACYRVHTIIVVEDCRRNFVTGLLLAALMPCITNTGTASELQKQREMRKGEVRKSVAHDHV